jgi:hypothetical protein
MTGAESTSKVSYLFNRKEKTKKIQKYRPVCRETTNKGAQVEAKKSEKHFRITKFKTVQNKSH